VHLIGRNITKSFSGVAIIDDLNFEINTGEHWAILGSNSAGKSTLLKIISGLIDADSGKIERWEGFDLRQINYSSPEMTLMDDFTIEELVNFHFSLRESMLPLKDFWIKSELVAFKNKRFQDLSSGLENKIKLALALLTKGHALFLDEPCTNFDQHNIQWYQNLVQEFWSEHIICIASNMKEEYFICNYFINLQKI
jgi:ABC-type multidrug transport system ATPase subunit